MQISKKKETLKWRLLGGFLLCAALSIGLSGGTGI
jgi:hypothetical protein